MAARAGGGPAKADGAGGPDAARGAVAGNGRLRLLVAAVVALEAAFLAGLAVTFVVQAARATATEPGGAVALAAVMLVLGAGLAICARGLAGGMRWARAPVLTWQLLQAGVAMPLSSSDYWFLGIPLLAMAIFVGALLLTAKVIPSED